MQTIYLIFLMCITAVGTFIAGVYAKQLAAFYKRLFTRKTRTSPIEQRIKQLEEELSNVAKFSKNRQLNLKKQIREEVRNYLKELQK